MDTALNEHFTVRFKGIDINDRKQLYLAASGCIRKFSSCIATIFKNGHCELATDNDNLSSSIKSEIQPSFKIFDRLLTANGKVVFKKNKEHYLHIVPDSSLQIKALNVQNSTARNIELGLSTGIKTAKIQNDIPQQDIKQTEIQNQSHKLEHRIERNTTNSSSSIQTPKTLYKKQFVDLNTEKTKRTNRTGIERKASKQIRRRQKNNKGDTLQPRKADIPIYSLKELSKTTYRSAFRIGNDDEFSVQVVIPLETDEGSYDNDLVRHPVQEDGYNQVGNVQISLPVQASDDQDGSRALPVNVTDDAQANALQTEYQNRFRLQNPARHSDYQSVSVRRDTFSNWQHPQNAQDIDRMAQTGLFYTGNQDLVRCFHCGIGLKDWSSADDPLQVHIRHSPDCEFLRATITHSELETYRNTCPIVNRHTDTEINSNQNFGLNDILPRPQSPQPRPGRIRNPDMQSFNARVASFTNWPSYIAQTPQQLAEAGFFYTGTEDIVRCYACDGGLRKWDPEDDPWIEHAHWFPYCTHVIRERGQEYINLIQVAATDDHEQDNGDVSRDMDHLYGNRNTERESDDPIYSSAAQTTMDFGFSRAAVKLAIQECNNKSIRWKAEDLVNLLLEKQEKGEVLPPDSPRAQSPVLRPKFDVRTKGGLLAEHEMLIRRIKCILCEEEDVNVLFLPCAHHNMCMTCAEDVTMCPICGKTIKEKIKTFMS